MSQEDWIQKEWELRKRNEEIDSKQQLNLRVGGGGGGGDDGEVEVVLLDNPKDATGFSGLGRSLHQYKLQNEKLAKEVENLKRERTNLLSDLKVAQLKLQKSESRRDGDNDGDAGKTEDLRREAAGLRRELEQQRKEAAKARAEANAGAVRISRLQEETSKLRAKEREQAEKIKELKREKDDVRSESKCEIAAREKQCRQLLLAYRKQAELVHVLKQQKLHLEACRVLDFTEEEFVNTLDWKDLLKEEEEGYGGGGQAKRQIYKK